MSKEMLIQLGHGSGGSLTQDLIEEVFYNNFKNAYLSQEHDSANLFLGKERLVFTTDSFVVQPLFFPNGDIGKLSVCGTVNDLAMSGARPLYLSCGFILEEGFLKSDLIRIAQSMQLAAESVGAHFVTGDTKVVERGKGDGVYINVSGIGTCEHNHFIAPQSIMEGDDIILSGDIGKHGMAIMAMRHGFELDPPLESDCGELWSPVNDLINQGIKIHCLRDLTRGGLATALVELAQTSKVSLEVEEEKIPISSSVHGACEILGLDPMYVANEGRFIAFVPHNESHAALKILQRSSITQEARVIGKVTKENLGTALLINSLGHKLPLFRLPGEQLPRIC